MNILNCLCCARRDSSAETMAITYRKVDCENQYASLWRNYSLPTEEAAGQVKGKIPERLEGTLITNGPGIKKIGDQVYNHLFDGLAVLHRYLIKDGTVKYMDRALESEAYKKNIAANRIVVSEFGTAGFPDPCKTIFQTLHTTFQTLTGTNLSDSCAVSVGYYGDQLYAMTETNAIRRIDPEDLKVIGNKTVITDYVAINHATAHPHVCKDGSIYNMGNNYSSAKGPHYVLAKIPPKFGSSDTCFKDAQIVAEIPFSSKRFPSYYHSFGITEDKLVFIESPWRLDIIKLFRSVLTNKTIDTAMVWKENSKARLHVVSLHGGKIHPVIYETEAFFAFHHINAYEDDGHIVVDVAGYDRIDKVLMTSAKDFTGDVSFTEHEATARRFVLPLNVENQSGDENLVTLKYTKARANLTGTKDGRPVVISFPEHLTQMFIELPRINYFYNGRKYNYFYGVSSDKGPNWTAIVPDRLIKVDLRNKTNKHWSEEGKIPNEPIFVANPTSKWTDEDDGVILSTLVDQKDDRVATLLILNAKDMQELARVEFKTTGPFTSSLHGQWANHLDKIHLL